MIESPTRKIHRAILRKLKQPVGTVITALDVSGQDTHISVRCPEYVNLIWAGVPEDIDDHAADNIATVLTSAVFMERIRVSGLLDPDAP